MNNALRLGLIGPCEAMPVAEIVESVEVPMTQAEFDATILVQAEEIRRDPRRFMAARSVNPNIQA